MDIEEFQKLLQQTARQRTKDVLSLEIRKLQTELTKLIEEKASTSTKSTNAESHSVNKRYEIKLNNYGWDQTNSMVKLYITLKDVHQLDKEAVTCNFTEKSIDLHVCGLDDKNYSLTINNLCEDIDVSKSSIKVKTDMIIVSLTKKIAQTWLRMTEVEKQIEESKAVRLSNTNYNSDIGGNIMNLMKKMYQEGDDELKKTIAKVWTENQEKNATTL